MIRRLTLEEALLVEEFGDEFRNDVFPVKRHSIRTLKIGIPTDSFYFINSKGETIILFRMDEKNRVTSLYSPLKASDCIRYLWPLKEVDGRLFKYLQSIIALHENEENGVGEIQIKGDIIFKPYSNRLNIVLQHDLGETKKVYEKLLSYGLDKLPISPKSTYSGKLEEVVTVVQKEYAIVSAKKGGKKVANTFGLAYCIGLTLYDKDNQIAAVAHIDGKTKVKESIPKILIDLAKVGGQKYEARLFGGSKLSAKQFVELIAALNQRNVRIVEADILEKAQSRNIGISVIGELYNNLFVDNDSSIGDRMRFAGISEDSSLRCHYKP